MLCCVRAGLPVKPLAMNMIQVPVAVLCSSKFACEAASNECDSGACCCVVFEQVCMQKNTCFHYIALNSTCAMPTTCKRGLRLGVFIHRMLLPVKPRAMNVIHVPVAVLCSSKFAYKATNNECDSGACCCVVFEQVCM